jgi:hypothetical protein
LSFIQGYGDESFNQFLSRRGCVSASLASYSILSRRTTLTAQGSNLQSPQFGFDHPIKSFLDVTKRSGDISWRAFLASERLSILKILSSVFETFNSYF